MRRKWRRSWARLKPGLLPDSITKLYREGISLKSLAKNLLPLAAAGIMLSSMNIAQALPADVVVKNGTVTVSQAVNVMNINQTSLKAIINSRTFNISNSETLNILQPSANAALLWKVLGNDPSAVYGHVNATGQLFLYSPGGIIFSSSAQVNVGSMVASTLNIADSDFLSGNYKFTGDDGSGTVTNQGAITAADGGYVALLGPQARNEGVIVTQKGTVALAAGKTVTLDINGDKLLNLAVSQAVLDAGAANHNLIQTDGGQVIITARAANTLASTVVNNSGIIQAKSASNVNGEIILDGGSSGTVENSGTLDASGSGAGETGGTVKVLGDKIRLTGTAKVDVSGTSGGGTALIGGNTQGKGIEHNATTTTVTSGATINADAITNGNGGKVVVWANDTTNYNGTISAQGGSVSGDGGNSEVSGKNKLVYQGTTDLRAANGTTGTLLLDPADYTIAETGGDMTPAALATALGSANVTIKSSDGTVNTNGSGDINVNDAVSWTGGTTLTLSAYRDINVNAGITNTGGGNLVLRADNTGVGTATLGTGHGTVSLAAPVSLTGGTGDGNKIDIYYNPASYADGATMSTRVYSGNFDMWTGQYSLVTTVTNPYTPQVTGNLTAYMLINTVDDLQKISDNTSGVYALGRDIDAGVTSSWNSGAGFTPIMGFGGIFDGHGQVVNGLYINNSDTWNNCAGLFGRTSGATIRNVGLTNVDITGIGAVGGLVGEADGWGYYGAAADAAITNCYSTGKVTSNNAAYLGGLVGYLSGHFNWSYCVPGYSTITNSYSTATVTCNTIQSAAAVGGLVGSLGSVSSVTNSYSTGPVTVTATTDSNGVNVGGLAGYSMGTITNSYSTGAVSLSNAVIPTGSAARVGGLVGDNEGTITNSYTTGLVKGTGDDIYAGGLVGYNAYYTIYYPFAMGVIGNSYSTGAVTASGSNNVVGGLVGYAESDISGLTDCYWDTGTSGISDQTQGIGNISGATGVTGLTTASLMDRSKYSGRWDFANTWFIIDGYTRPFLRSEYSTSITNAHQLQLMAMDLNAHYTLGASIDMSELANAAGLWNTTGFVPVGSETTPFTGTLNGNGYAIRGLTINNPALPAIGLFGYISGAAAKVGNVGLTDLAITGGTNNTYVGGVAGYNDGGTITKVYTTGTVSGGTATGGVAGFNKGTIDRSYSMCTVTGSVNVGGLAGINAGSILNSYLDAAGAVTGSGAASKAGGLAGTNSGTIITSYSAGAVSGGTAGGLVGDGTGGTIGGSVWNMTTSGPANGVGSDPAAAGATGLNTAQMKDSANYPGWDFTDTWSISGARPLLQWEYQGSVLITSLDQLLLMGKNPGGTYILDTDLDLTGVWVPIGSNTNPFTGILKGNGYTIRGLTITGSTSAYLGLFGYTQGAAISSLNLADVNITAGSGNLYVGSLVGYSGSGTSIKSCTSAGSITAGGPGTAVGGLVGYNAGSIEGSANAGQITVSGAGNSIGGLAGVSSGSIATSWNTGIITAGAGSTGSTGSIIGGLAGTNTGAITDCYSSADSTVTSDAANTIAGGLTGENDGSITDSYNKSKVIASGNATAASVGGLAGKNSGHITGSYNAAQVKADGDNSNAGGLLGWNATNGNVNQAYNTGTVTAAGSGSKVGGLAGLNSGLVLNAYNLSPVTAGGPNSSAGGLIGANDGRITCAYSIAAVTDSGADSNAGGLVGVNTGNIANAFAVGAVTGVTAGGLAGTNTGTISGAYWNRATSGQSKGIGDGSAVGVQELTTADLMKSVNYTDWDSGIWAINDGYSFPYLRSMYSNTPQTISGVVQGGGAGKTVGIACWSAVFQTASAGADGFYYTIMPANTIPIRSDMPVVLYVTGDSSYRANRICYPASNGCLTGGDLMKSTVIVDGINNPIGLQPYSFMMLSALAANTSDKMFSMTSDGIKGEYIIDGNLMVKNCLITNWMVTGTCLTATGSITINTPNDVYFLDPTTQISAGGDITIITNGDFVFRSYSTPSFYYTFIDPGKIIRYPGPDTQISAGGNVTIVTDADHDGNGQFVNFGNEGSIASGGRTLIYTNQPVISAANPTLFYAVRYQFNYAMLTSDRYFAPMDEEFWNQGGEVGYNPEMLYGVAGGMQNDFILWETQYGDDVPATGSGFVYCSANPLTQPAVLTPSQIMRREAITAARGSHTLVATAPPQLITTPLPFLTIAGSGVAIETAGSGPVTAEQAAGAAEQAQKSGDAVTEAGK